MPSPSRLLAYLLPVVAGALAAPSPQPAARTPGAARARSPEFFRQVRSMLGNGTEEDALAKRQSAVSASGDGIDSAGFYWSLYNDNGAGVSLTEYDTTGQWQIGWQTAGEQEWLAGKGFRSTTPQMLTWSGYHASEGDWTLAVYGWTTDPVTEWYVVENHGTGTPGDGNSLGTVTSADGGVYDVYDLFYDNVEEIYGATSFHQYWSVRQVPRDAGSVDVQAHFDGWAALGLLPGAPVFQMVTLEGFEGSGYCDFTLA
ncbi:xylanase [Xylariomycetidae sp. FL0641]|nr:xylanase [Xylariomycetidae sp. FL0641]